MKPTIHKTVGHDSKADNINPTLCTADLTSEDAHKYSRVKWDKVTCKKCLSMRTGKSGWAKQHDATRSKA